MFISRDRFIIKTCGSTSLLECLEPLLYVAKDIAGFDDVLDVFFSRKNFLRPELQPKPHSNFAMETELLDSFFEGWHCRKLTQLIDLFSCFVVLCNSRRSRVLHGTHESRPLEPVHAESGHSDQRHHRA